MTMHDTRMPDATVTIEDLAPDARFSLRVGADGRAAASETLGLDLPVRVGDVARGAEERTALCLGPDEWLITAPAEAGGAIARAFADLYDRTPHSLVDVSDREVTVRVTGPEALTLMTIGCPRDLARLAPGRAVRTVFDGATVILWRDAEDTFRMDVWRSFAPFVRDLLEIGRAEIAAGL
ncbi:sarcosine oxidase subunit gamma [Hasllibacter halocynthiae]|uniref:Sarcosine oxidase subunit gamma n=1 Tax=Hasllibacter halocynthiae TaxID=595589 RepID=A0A2T0X9V9_9RHOB|nr:sarcosine oxidase subunit gamma family protein [Hasllibacter halocynthiae]PRY95732.1 sarcosine oxidase subunit gamma [Hasllibacter halocynthiae]